MRLLLVLILVVLIAAPAAMAFPGERPANRITQQAVQVGLRFWADRGVHPCAPVRVLVAHDLGDGITGHAEPSTCTMWVQDTIARMRSWRAYVCGVVTHELGHLAGLGHTSGVMSGVEIVIPWDCRVWARENVQPLQGSSGGRRALG